MKLKIFKLTLFFLAVGLLSSSRQTTVCNTKCDSEGITIENNTGSGFGSDIDRTITPGNFIFSTKNF